MPYSIAIRKGCSPSKQWAVVKDSDGTIVACHETKESALAQIKALYISEPALAKARERLAKHGNHDQSSHAGVRHGGQRLKEPANPKAPAGSQSPEAISAAKAVRERTAEIEPELTRSMIDVAQKHGGEAVGLDHRLKSEKSLARKIDDEKGDFGGDATKTADSMSDVVRYTISLPEGAYVEGTQAVLDDLQAQGMKTRVKNYWKKGDPYQGINVAVTTPKGITFELQFHTAQSLVAKEQCHKAYEKYRVSNSARERYKYWNQGVRIAESVPIPPGDILGFGTVKEQTFTAKAHNLNNLIRSVNENLTNSGSLK